MLDNEPLGIHPKSQKRILHRLRETDDPLRMITEPGEFPLSESRECMQFEYYPFFRFEQRRKQHCGAHIEEIRLVRLQIGSKFPLVSAHVRPKMEDAKHPPLPGRIWMFKSFDLE